MKSKLFGIIAGLLVAASAALAQIALPWPGPGGPVVLAGATCTTLGTASATSQAAGPASLTLTTTANVPLYGTIVVAAVLPSQGSGLTVATISGVADSAGNPYILIRQQLSSSSTANTNDVELWYTRTAIPLPSGSTITITWAGNSGSITRPVVFSALTISGNALYDTFNLVSGPATSTAPSVNTTPTQAPGLAVGFVGANAASAPTVTEASGWTNVARSTGVVNTVNAVLNVACISYASAATQTYNPTFSVNLNFNGAIIATFSPNTGTGSACTVTGAGNSTAAFRSFQRYVITSSNAAAITCPSPRSVYVCMMGGQGGSDASGCVLGCGGPGGGGVVSYMGAIGQLQGGANNITIGSNGASGVAGNPTSLQLFQGGGGKPGFASNGGAGGTPGGGAGGLNDSIDSAGGGGGGGLAGTNGQNAPGTSTVGGGGGNGSFCIDDDTQYNPGIGGTGPSGGGSNGNGTAATKAVFWEAPSFSPTITASARVTGSGSTWTTTTTAAIGGGNAAFVFLASGNNTLVSSVSDGTNSYTKATAGAGGGVIHNETWYVISAAAVSSGATITVTASGSVAGALAYIIGAQSPGVTAFDSAANTSVTGCTTSNATAAQQNELAFGFVSGTAGAGYTASTSAANPGNWVNLNYGGSNATTTAALDWSATPRANSTSWNYAVGSGFSASGCNISLFKGN
jgi:hypothetical protein